MGDDSFNEQVPRQILAEAAARRIPTGRRDSGSGGSGAVDDPSVDGASMCQLAPTAPNT
jgi:hypothetical protein